jgi:transcriptional regulator with XRE-family HTH domain
MLKERVKSLRKAKGWSQIRLAKEAKVSQQAIGKIETGKALESRKLPQIAAALGVTAEELLGETPASDSGLSDRENALLRAFRRADSSIQQAAERVLGIPGRPFPKKPPASPHPPRPRPTQPRE